MPISSDYFLFVLNSHAISVLFLCYYNQSHCNWAWAVFLIFSMRIKLDNNVSHSQFVSIPLIIPLDRNIGVVLIIVMDR